MEEEGIGLVLARATELRFKISNCIHKATSTPSHGPEQEDGKKQGGGEGQEEEEEEEEEEEMERLLNISDALQSLETQLSSLQVFGLTPPFFFIRVFLLKPQIWIACF